MNINNLFYSKIIIIIINLIWYIQLKKYKEINLLIIVINILLIIDWMNDIYYLLKYLLNI